MALCRARSNFSGFGIPNTAVAPIYLWQTLSYRIRYGVSKRSIATRQKSIAGEGLAPMRKVELKNPRPSLDEGNVELLHGNKGSIIHPWLSGKGVPRDWWKITSNQRVYLDWLGDTLGYKNRSDWYQVTGDDIKANGGRGLITLHRRLPFSAVSFVYTDFTFYPWLFRQVPKGFWDIQSNRVKYINWLKIKVGVSDESQLQLRHFEKNKGGGLLSKYQRSPALVIESLKSNDLKRNDDELIMKRRQPLRYWASMENQKNYLDLIGSKIGVKGDDLSPWYSQNVSGLMELGFSGGLFDRYGGSLFAMLSAVYPEFDWQPWKFGKMPRYSGDNTKFIEEALSYAELSLSLNSPEDWYRVSQHQLMNLGLQFLFRKRYSLFDILKQHRPSYNWVEARFIT